MQRDAARRQFASYLRTLDDTELSVLEGTFGNLLDGMGRRLRDWVCMVHEHDYYFERDGYSEEEDAKQQMNERVHKAMKKRAIKE